MNHVVEPNAGNIQVATVAKGKRTKRKEAKQSDPKLLLAESVALAEKLGVVITFDVIKTTVAALSDNAGGICRVGKTWRVIIDKRHSDMEKCLTLMKCLAKVTTLSNETLSPDLARISGLATQRRV